jgi:hypothetical protein
MVTAQPIPNHLSHLQMVEAAQRQQPNPETQRIKEHVIVMGVALWCDPGDHAFKGGTPGSQSFMGTEVDDEGKEKNVQVNVCPDHTFRTLTGEPGKAKAITERTEK